MNSKYPRELVQELSDHFHNLTSDLLISEEEKEEYNQDLFLTVLSVEHAMNMALDIDTKMKIAAAALSAKIKAEEEKRSHIQFSEYVDNFIKHTQKE